MSALLLMLAVAALLALIPSWRLHLAGWPRRTVLVAWIGYTVALFVAIRFVGVVRYLLPILILAYVAPIVAGPERLSRVLHVQRRDPGVVINVTPRPPTELPEPPRSVGSDGHAGDDEDHDGAGKAAGPGADSAR